MSNESEAIYILKLKNKLSISHAEIALVAGYFLAVWMVPESWLETAVGAIAFAVASKVNPYLSEYSIAFAEEPQYFIHCHVLATWMLVPLAWLLIVNRNGGFVATKVMFEKRAKSHGLLPMLLGIFFLITLLMTMLWDIRYPLGRAERGVWVNEISVCIFSFMNGWLGSVFIYLIVFVSRIVFRR